MENKLNNYYHAKSHTVETGGQQRPDETSVTYTLILEGEPFLAKHFFFKSRSIKKINHMNDFISSMQLYVGLPALAWDFTLQLLGQLLIRADLAYLTAVLSLENLVLYFGEDLL